MIRKSREIEKISDEEFAKIIDPATKDIKNYVQNLLFYDFLAFVLQCNFNHDAIWEDSNLELEYRTYKDDWHDIPKYEKIDIKKLNKILKEKYSLCITNVNPISIEKIQ